MFSEKYGEITERIPLSEELAIGILSEEKRNHPQWYGFCASLDVNGESIFYTENTGVPKSVMDLAVEKCGYQFASPDSITASIKEAIRYGVARGLFSNEAGMGSTPHAHAVARVKHPAEQGLAAIVGLFIDTFVVLNATAIVILVTGSLDGQATGIVLTQNAFVKGMGEAGSGFVAICLFFAAFTTIIGWYFFAVQNVKYLFGYKVINVFSVMVLAFLMMGSFLHVDLVWELADMFNGLMVIPNIIAVVGLYKLVIRALNDYDNKFLKDERPFFGPSEKLTNRFASLHNAVRSSRRAKNKQQNEE